ncbi:MAG: UDP-N-acetylmuramoyl-L-alanyl-D-glutamate--2,6-diaminopimelate ligase [Aestuariibacter sp.]
MTHKTICNLKSLLQPFAIEAPEIELRDLVLDSRDVAIHSAFLAVKGHALDGREFIPQAISLGAKVILVDVDDASQHGHMEMREHTLLISFYELQQQVSKLAAVFFDEPAFGLDTVAITGTNGKTSTTHFACQLSELLRKPATFVGTLGAGPLANMNTTRNTTPDPISMQRIAYQALQRGAKFMAFEASSHALVQNRLSAFKTDVAIFTNLSRDHLDYHGDMASYAAAKRLLLQQPGLRSVIVNIDDPEAQNWLAVCPPSCKPFHIGIESESAPQNTFFIARDINYLTNGMQFSLHTESGKWSVETPLLGRFNIYNLLAACAAQVALGHELSVVVEQLDKVKAVTGRAELIRLKGQANVVIDYAHTPDALEKILQALRSHSDGKIFCLFGCGGERDQGKRPLMAKMAEQYADVVMVTSDNPRSESPEHIIDDILKGFEQPERVLVEPNRATAICQAVAQAMPEDIVLLAGKGHETYQVIGAETRQFNERQFIEEKYEVLP